MKHALDRDGFEYPGCSSGELLRMVLLYRLSQLFKRRQSGELPSLRSAFRAYRLHRFGFLSRFFAALMGQGWRT